MRPLFIGYGEDHDKLGVSDLIGRSTPKRIELTADDLKTHIHGVGASRVGKSKLIEWIARELIRNHQGFCLIDPHGQLYDELTQWLTHSVVHRNVILFNPSYDERIVGFNPFIAHDEGDISTHVDRLVKATVKCWGSEDTDQTPRLDRNLRCLYYAMIDQRIPLSVAFDLLTFERSHFRSEVISKIQSDFARNHFSMLNQFRAADFFNQVESTVNRLSRFVDSLQVKRIINLPTNNLDLERIVEEGKILLVNLQPTRGKLTPENGKLLGTLLLSELWDVAQHRRPKRVGMKPSDFFVIVDEFQEYLTPDIPSMLTGAAKYGMHLVLFHQHLKQLQKLDEQVYGSLTNAQIKIVFGGLGDEDATQLVRELFPGQINYDHIQFLIKQMQFWPVVGRARVYTSSSTTASGSSSSGGLASGMSWGDYPATARHHSTVDISSDGYFSSDSHSEGESDVPFIYPEAHEVVTSKSAYPPEVIISEIAAALRNQYQRHFFVKRPDKPTVAAVTPFVKLFHASPDRIAHFVEKRCHEFLPASEVDRSLISIKEALLLSSGDKVQLQQPKTADDFFEKPIDDAQ